MAASAVKIGGAWKVAANGYVKIDGVWRVIANSYIKTPTGWQQGTLGQPPAAPVLVHTAFGKWTITNYDAGLAYDGTGTGGVVTIAGATVTVVGVNSIATINARRAVGAPASSSVVERKAYTYHQENHPICSPNCRPISGNCFDGTGSCQGDGACGADGTICCGGSMGSTCSPNYVQVKDPTPAGYRDEFGEWVKP